MCIRDRLEAAVDTAYQKMRQTSGELKALETKLHNITTSYGLGGAIPFALELVRQLAGQAEADRIQNAIAYRH